MRAPPLTVLVLLAVLPACAHRRDTVTAEPAPASAAAPSSASAVEHPLAPDFRRLGEALATFWRAEERFPSDLEELRGFAVEHRLDLRLAQITNLSLRATLYGKILSGHFDFPLPAGAAGSWRSSAAFQLDATDPEGVAVSFQAASPEGQSYLEEAYRMFTERFSRR